MKEVLIQLFEGRFSESVREFVPMGTHASTRRLMRLKSDSRSVVGVQFNNLAENRAFVSFSRHFRSLGLPVPEIFIVSADESAYLQEDFGDTTLFDLLHSVRAGADEVPLRVQYIYAEVVRLLSYFQIEGSQGLDYSLCYESPYYDKTAMLYDCSRFVEELVKRIGLDFNSSRLFNDFESLIEFLLQADNSFFMYRDFQARNIMIREDKPCFIDYQSGRHGALQYDLASLLYQSQARLPEGMRDSLLNVYLEQLSLRRATNREQFFEFFDGFVLIRLIQVLGAYGKLGLGEQKAYFLKGIPFATATFLEVLARQRVPVRFPEITALFARLTQRLE